MTGQRALGHEGTGHPWTETEEKLYTTRFPLWASPQPVVSKREKPQLGEGEMCPGVPAQLGAMWRLWARASSIGRLAIRGWRERHRASGFCK